MNEQIISNGKEKRLNLEEETWIQKNDIISDELDA